MNTRSACARIRNGLKAPAQRIQKVAAQISHFAISAPARLLVLDSDSALAIVPISSAYSAIIPIRVVDHAIFKQAGKIVGVDCITHEERLRDVEDFLHGAQVGRVSEEDVAGKGNAAHVGMSVG